MNKTIINVILAVSILLLSVGCGSSVSPDVGAKAASTSPSGDAAVAWSSVYLTDITLSAGTLDPIFSKDIVAYTVQVPNTVASITITPTAEDTNSSLTVDGEKLNSGNISSAIALVVNVPRTIDIKVVSSKGNGSKTYSVTVTRIPSNNANLSSMDVNGAVISPVFNKNTIIYSAIVPTTTDRVSVQPILEDLTATLEVNANSISSGDIFLVDLNPGYNMISTVVTAQNGDKKTYTVIITRGNSDADLSDLSVVDGANVSISINPVFNADITTYSIQLGSSVTDIRVTADANDPYAVISINGTTVNSGFQSDNIAINSGVNTIKVQTSSSDNSTQKTYFIIAVKP